MDGVYHSCGCVTLTMTVEMTPMSQLTCVDREIAQQAGSGVLVSLIIVVFPNGCSVTAKTIAATTAMSCQTTAPSAR